MTGRRAAVVGAVVAALLLAAPVQPAWAYLTSAGSGRGPAPVATLAPPAEVTAVADADDVDVSWEVVDPPGDGTVGYVVARTPVPSGPALDVCGSVDAPLVGTTTCTDGAVPDGTYEYSVTAVYATWTAVSDPSAPVTVGTAPTTTSLDLSSTTATDEAEDGLSFAVDVEADGTEVTTGTVDVASGPTDLCTVTLPDTSCSPAPDALDPSDTPYPVVATFSGAGGFDGSVSPPQYLTVYDPLEITTDSLAPARSGETGYSQTLTATGGMPDLVWSTNGNPLPGGLSLDPSSGIISGSVAPGAQTTVLTISVTDGNGAAITTTLTLVVRKSYVQEFEGHTSSDAASVVLTLQLAVAVGDGLVLSLAQSCTKSAGGAVDSHVTGVSGGSVTWTRAGATGCSPDGDAELWYGLDATGAAAGAKVTVTLQSAASVQFADVTEYTGLAAHDPSAGATAVASGTTATAGPGPVTPASAGELIVADTFVTWATPHVLTGLIGPFVPLQVATPYQGVGVYAVDATAAALSPSYTQTVSGTSTAGPWSSIATAFTFAP